MSSHCTNSCKVTVLRPFKHLSQRVLSCRVDRRGNNRGLCDVQIRSSSKSTLFSNELSYINKVVCGKVEYRPDAEILKIVCKFVLLLRGTILRFSCGNQLINHRSRISHSCRIRNDTFHIAFGYRFSKVSWCWTFVC
ncbi:hypothetical protein KCU76_g85, partial [Aureobasidium melanogenum]